MAITALGLFFFSGLQSDTPLAAIVANLALLGFGFALFSSPNMSAIMGSVARRHYGVASGAVATMRLLGQMASMAAATVVLDLFMGKRLIEPATYPQFSAATRSYFLLFAALCCIGVVFSLARGNLRE
jgi:hypothetical protein